MPENPFNELLREFQQARADHDMGFFSGGFMLDVVPANEASGYHQSTSCGYIGSVWFRETDEPGNTFKDLSGYSVFGPFRSRGWEPSPEACNLFISLAQRAGACLPPAVRDRFSIEHSKPIDAWLAAMWLYSPPTKGQFGQPMRWHHPFFAAIETIERAGLVGNHTVRGNVGQDGWTHSPDYRSVRWDGEDYHFTANQAACVQQLWEAWENGTPDVGDETLLATAGADSKRLRDVFKDNEVWGKVIVEGKTKGTHRIADPRRT